MILGNCINISTIISPKQAEIFAQWIGSSNVVRNQKIKEMKEGFDKNLSPNQGYSHLKKIEGLTFLKSVPPQILRNASSLIYQDYQAFVKEIRSFPKIKSKGKKRSALITKELFSLQVINKEKTLLTIFSDSTQKKQPIFSITLNNNIKAIGNQFRLSRQGKKFYLSYSYDNNVNTKSNEALLKELSYLDEKELKPLILGVDRGIARPIQMSNGKVLGYSDKEKERLKQKAKKKARYQRILARKKRNNKNSSKKCESNRQRKIQTKITKIDNDIAHIRINACHHWSKELANDAPKIVAFEDLNLKGMTKKAKPKKDKNGRKYIRNRGNAKSGLNRSLLHHSLGRIADYTKYKLNLQGKAWVKVNPKNTSKEHHVCGEKNTSRPNQSTLICHTCNKVENADENASKTIRNRAITYIKEERFTKVKTRKSITLRKKQVEGDTTSLKKSDSVVVVNGCSTLTSVCNNAITHRNKTSYVEAHDYTEHCLKQE